MNDILSAAAESGSTGNALIILLLVGAAGWLVSLWLHPFTACSSCHGTPKSYGAIAKRSFRICSTCGGTGRRKRVGAGMFGSRE